MSLIQRCLYFRVSFKTGSTLHTYKDNYLLKDEINWAADVDVHEVDVGVGVDELSATGHGVGKRPTHLHSKDVLRLVSPQEGPLALLALKRHEQSHIT